MTQTQTAHGAPNSLDGDADAELDQLYADFAAADMTPLWSQRDDLMPTTPQPAAIPTLWRWSTLLPLAERSGALVPVGRGGERRAIALANPGITGQPYTTATLWTAIQYLGPGRPQPHIDTYRRHSGSWSRARESGPTSRAMPSR